MAAVSIQHRCGHWQDHPFETPLTSKSIRKLRSMLCTECYREEKQREDRVINSALPVLSGTDKQVLWALTVRARFFRLVSYSSMSDDVMEELKRLCYTKTSAKYWIENRDMGERETFIKMIRTMEVTYKWPEDIYEQYGID